MKHADPWSGGSLVIPDPDLEAVYRSLGASTTHCEVRPDDGGLYSCLSVDPRADLQRHTGGRLGDVVRCRSCVPVGDAAPIPDTAPAPRGWSDALPSVAHFPPAEDQGAVGHVADSACGCGPVRVPLYRSVSDPGYPYDHAWQHR